MTRSDFTITAEMEPISKLNPLSAHTSPPRKVMMGGNLTQTNVVRGATRKRLRSGLEREHAKGTIKHMFDQDAVILDVIPKFSSKYLKPGVENPMSLVVYEDYNTRQLCCIELQKYHVMHQHYGFNFKFDEEVMERIYTPGARFEKGTVIANSPNVTPDGDYMIGLEAIVAFTTDASVSEDGMVFSESFAKNIRTPGIEKRSFSCGRTHYPGNSYGNADVYKSIPDIGDFTHTNGLLATFRPFDQILNPIYMTRRSLMAPVYGMDVPLFGIANAKVIDIDVLHNPKSAEKGLPPEFTAQLRHYHEAIKEYYLRVIKAVMLRTGKTLSTSTNLHPDLWQIIYEAIGYVGDELVKMGAWPADDIERLQLQRGYRGELLDEWRVEITFQYTTEVAEGPKVTNLHGSKGVGVAVWPDECMPLDEFGNRADVMQYGGSTVSRMSPGQLHEQLINAAGRDVIKRIRRAYGFGDFEQLEFRSILEHLRQTTRAMNYDQYQYLLGWYKIISPDVDHPRALRYLDTPERWLIHLAHVIEDGNEPYGTFIRLSDKERIDINFIIGELEHGPYRPEMSRVRYKWPGDTEFTWTEEEILLGSTYFLPLEKTATDWSGVSSSKVGHFGTTVRMSQSDKYTRPGRETSTRSTGEAEKRNISKSVGGQLVADFADMNNNPAIHEQVCRSIVTAEYPTNIYESFSREEYPFGGHRPLGFLKHMTFCSGKEFSND